MDYLLTIQKGKLAVSLAKIVPLPDLAVLFCWLGCVGQAVESVSWLGKAKKEVVMEKQVGPSY
jgi:hypothetical protein